MLQESARFHSLVILLFDWKGSQLRNRFEPQNLGLSLQALLNEEVGGEGGGRLAAAR